MGTRFILIPVQQCSSNLRPSQNMQLASGKRVVLQPLRHPGAVNLYRHPNGQIIQLVPLHQIQTSGAQSNLQPIMLRNPGTEYSKYFAIILCNCVSNSEIADPGILFNG